MRLNSTTSKDYSNMFVSQASSENALQLSTNITYHSPCYFNVFQEGKNVKAKQTPQMDLTF